MSLLLWESVYLVSRIISMKLLVYWIDLELTLELMISSSCWLVD